jgi:uncharacterized membrane protein YukC
MQIIIHEMYIYSIENLILVIIFIVEVSQYDVIWWIANYTRENAQVVTSLQTSCYKSVHKSCLIQSWYNRNVTRLMTQGCNNVVISWLSLRIMAEMLEQPCNKSDNTNKVVTTVNKLFHTCWQLGTSSANTTCWRSCYKMRDSYVCSFLNGQVVTNL